MPKGVVESAQTPLETGASRLREDLAALEVAVADLGRGRGSVLDTLRLRDAVEEDAATLGASGVGFKPEQTRIDTIDNILARRAGRIGRFLQGTSPAAEARRAEKPPEQRWWWYLDSLWAARWRRSVVKYGVILIVVVLALVGGDYVMNRFFGMSPTERAAHEHIASGEQYLYGGRYDEAIVEYEAAAAVTPDALDPQIALAVLYEKQGRATEAQVALAKATAVTPNRAALELGLARSYTALGNLDSALLHADAAVGVRPESAEVYLIRATVYEGRGDTERAIADLETAGDLATAQGQSTLYVLARTRLGMILQEGSAGLGQPGFGQ
jgi:tetratricopeptide (TPR) repeat protein